ncbi:hypothetical protein CXF79_04540 [Colwellia sp. Bg11-28]|nr:hypothetical protein CXF79_04540 [Colwellia sp. Bg11-28]
MIMSREQMKVEFHNAVKTAVMTKRPLVVVEGKDDLSVYIDLINSNDNKFNVKPIEYFKECTSGCAEIENKVTFINEKYSNSHLVYKYFKGVVDSDAKAFRNEKNERPGILYLNSYSFENSFVTEKSIIETIKTLTSVSREQLNLDLTTKVIDLINTRVTEFYYITLEALRNAVEEDYDSLLGFSDGYERFIYDDSQKELLEAKYSDLDTFAQRHNITNGSILQMKDFCKGKWHLHFFLKSLLHFLKELHQACGQSITQCPLCEIGDTENCLYKKNTDMNVAQLISVIKNNIENSDLNYVKETLRNMA